jgi:hypothetical protein
MNAGTVPGGSTRNKIETNAVVAKSSMRLFYDPARLERICAAESCKHRASTFPERSVTGSRFCIVRRSLVRYNAESTEPLTQSEHASLR